MGTLMMKQHDTAPALRAALTDGNGNVVDLTTAATIKCIAVLEKGRTPLFTRVITPSESDRTAGIVTCAWQAGDTALEARILVEFEVTWGDGTVQTFPGVAQLAVDVRADLG